MNVEITQYLKEKAHGTLELLHNMENYLFIVNMSGEVLITSDSFFEGSGLKREDVIHKKYYDLLKLPNRPLDFFDLLLLDEEKRDHIEVSIKSAGGSDIPALIISSSFLTNFYNNEDFVLLLVADISDQKKAQMQLMHTNKMLSLGEMATNIAHEINNPLAIITGQLLMLKKSIQKIDGDTTKALELTTKIDKNFHRITKIIASLRNISKKSDNIPFETVSLESIIEGVKDLCDQRLFSKHIDFKITGEIEGIDIVCHDTEVMQVLLNLINNAVDSICELEQKWIKLDIKNDAQNIIISVVDSGDGIDLEAQIKLFEPFFTTKDIGKGTGLGLSISKGLIEAHGGELIYEPNSQNTTFNIILPKSGPSKQV